MWTLNTSPLVSNTILHLKKLEPCICSYQFNIWYILYPRKYIKWIFGARRWNRSLLHSLRALTWYCSTSRNSAPEKKRKETRTHIMQDLDVSWFHVSGKKRLRTGLECSVVARKPGYLQECQGKCYKGQRSQLKESPLFNLRQLSMRRKKTRRRNNNYGLLKSIVAVEAMRSLWYSKDKGSYKVHKRCL